MADNFESTMKWKVDIAELKSAMVDAKRSISLANAEFKTATAGMDKWSTSASGLEAKLKQLNTVLPQQRTILSQLESQYAIIADTLGEDSTEAQKLKITIENQRASIAKTEAQIEKYSGALEDVQTSSKSLTKTIDEQESELAQLKTAYVDAVAQYGKHSKEARDLAKQIKTLSGDLEKNEKKQSAASKEADKFDKTLKDTGDTADDTGKSINKLTEGLSVMQVAMGNLVAQGVLALVDGLKQIGKAAIDTGKQAIMSYADYEQLVGGVETLFGTGGKSIEEYAASVGKTTDEVSEEYDKMMKAQADVLKNASDAYKTAGLSQNEYMETVTSFSASLIDSLNGDTEKAARLANQAIIDMSDNANKMGSDISTLQSAYSGFSRGQFQLLDNLKLGYSGTKEGMQELIADANELRKAQGKAGNLTIKSYSDIIEAIHLVQSEMGITGTTAKEATDTITGSLNMTKAAWSNLLTGMADDNADFDALISNFTESATAFGKNILPRVITTIAGLSSAVTGLIDQLLPPILEVVPDMITQAIPQVINAVNSVLRAVMAALPSIVKSITTVVPMIVTSLAGMLPQLLASGISMIMTIATGMMDAVPDLLAIVPDLITDLLEVFNEWLPDIVDTGITLAESLVDGLLEAAPEIMETVPQIITTIVTAIVENLPQILSAGARIISKIAEGISSAIPQIAAAIPPIIVTIVKAIAANFPQIMSAGVQLIKALISGISSMLGSVMDVCGRIVSAIMTVVGTAATKVFNVGANIVKGIWQGIRANLGWIKNKISGWVGDVVSFLKNLFGINSPSKLMEDEIGDFLPSGMAIGFEKTLPAALKRMKKSLTTGLNGLKSDVAVAASAASGFVAGGSADGTAAGGRQQIVNFNQYNNSPKALDRLTIYRETNSLLFSAKVRLGDV